MAENEETSKKEQVQQDNRTRAQKARDAHAKATEERAKIASDVRTSYQAEKDGPVLTDLLAKAKQFISYHNKVAQDGVGARRVGDSMEEYILSPAERCAQLDKAAGIQELVDYIERQLVIQPQPAPAAEDAATEE